MLHFLVISIAIALIAIIAVSRSGKTPLAALVVLFAVVGIGAAFLHYDRYTVVSERAGEIDELESTVDSLISLQSNLSNSLAFQRLSLDSLEAVREQVQRQIAALEKRAQTAKSQLAQTPAESAADDHIAAQPKSTGQLGVKLGEPIRGQNRIYFRIDEFRATNPQGAADVSIYLKFNRRFERLIIEQNSMGELPGQACPEVDTVYSSAFIDYKCEFLARDNVLEITTYSELPLLIEEIKISPR